MLSSRLTSVSKNPSRSTLNSSLSASSPTIILRSAARLPRNEQTRGIRFGFWSSCGSQKELNQRHRVLKQRCADAMNWHKAVGGFSGRHGDAIQQSRNVFQNLMTQNSILEKKMEKLLCKYQGMRIVVGHGPRAFVRMTSNSVEDPGYDIDPITNRKVPRKNSQNSSETAEQSSNIPVRTFKEHRVQHQDPNPKRPKEKSTAIPSTTSFGRNEEGIEHRTEADKANLMEYEIKYDIDYSKGYYNDEPLEWYPRKLTQEDMSYKRAQLEHDFITGLQKSQEADEIYANRVALLKEEQNRRKERARTQEIAKQADEIFARKQALENTEAERRRTEEVIRKSDEIHANLVAHEEAEQERRKAQAISDQVEKLHANFIRNEEAEKASRKLNDLAIENSELRNVAAHLDGRISTKIDELNAATVKSPRLTGNFSRDFPEEFKESWKIENGTQGQFSKVQTVKEEPNTGNDFIHGRAPQQAFSRNSTTPRMETSLDRSVHNAHLMAEKQKARKHTEVSSKNATPSEDSTPVNENDVDSHGYSDKPMGLQTNYAEECQREGKPIGEMWSSTYGTPKQENAPVDEHGYSTKPMGLQTSFVRECIDEGKPMGRLVSTTYGEPAKEAPEVDEHGYSMKPIGLQTSYKDECKREGKPVGQFISISYGEPAKEEPEIDEHGYSEEPMGLQTSYKEECKREGKPIGQFVSTSYGEPVKEEPEVDEHGYSEKPMGLQTSYKDECKREGKVMGELHSSSYGKPVKGIHESAQDSSVIRKVQSNKSKKERKELDKNLVRTVRAIYEDTYGQIDTKHRQVPESTVEQVKVQNSEEPNQYKILAYDPTMQSVSIAETTSIVTDTASPLTPAEVLLRLSNPAKFFPHFGPLQSQGFEIVSGSGDVLVFRKVRAGEPFLKTKDSKKNINPIDGMESRPVAATGNFASPTGFVNHDIPVDPPFKSNIDVRREEPVFSGAKSTWSDTEQGPKRKTRGRGKRLLIGAFWVGACSYAVGVVAEFFRTGGVDGMGPTGF